ncbi:MAG: carboxylating nicotinate-nucleotide diphosphorylase [Hyphomonadaceae bacterium]|nr:carboxylating nicotinate-nucleotide diphosphorylase [Hyphomonadaceae bacterium]
MPELSPLPPVVIEPVIRRALEEDFGAAGDVTANLLVPEKNTARLYFRSRSDGVIAGMQAARMTCAMVDATIEFGIRKGDGVSVKPGDIVATADGPVRSMLMAERTVLNFLGRLSGIATLTSKYVDLVKGTRARIAATRKTTPGLRVLEKHAVLAGGGYTHRQTLSDAILIKDNHIALSGGIENALVGVMKHADHMVRISIEVDTLEQLKHALPYGPHVVLLDNMTPDRLREAVEIVNRFYGPRPTLEASGGVNLDTVKAIAEAGIDVISVGAITHSATNFDIGLDAS